MTDESAFKKQVRARMAGTGEKYTVARRMVIAGVDRDRSPEVLRVYLSPHVDLELTAEAARAYAAADERGRRELAGRLLMDAIEAGSIVTEPAATEPAATEPQLQTGAADADDPDEAAILDAVRRSMERAVGVSAVEIESAADRVHVTIRAARPDVAWGLGRAAATEGAWRESAADRLRGELERLTGRRVRLDIRQTPTSS